MQASYSDIIFKWRLSDENFQIFWFIGTCIFFHLAIPFHNMHPYLSKAKSYIFSSTHKQPYSFYAGIPPLWKESKSPACLFNPFASGMLAWSDFFEHNSLNNEIDEKYLKRDCYTHKGQQISVKYFSKHAFVNEIFPCLSDHVEVPDVNGPRHI